MHGDPVLGDPTDADRESAAAMLQAAEHAWDVRAAALSGAGADGGGRTAAVLRGGPAGPGEADPAKGPAFPRDLLSPDTAQWEQTLADLVDGRIGTVLFMEFTSDRVNVIKAVVDRSGIPRQTDAGSTDWDSVVPLLDPRGEIRRFQLAGGIGTLPVVGRGEFDNALTRWLRDHIPPACAHTVVLVDRRAGWPLLDRAAALLRTTYALRAELRPAPAGPVAPGGAAGQPVPLPGTDTEAVVREALRTAPLLADHTLLLARVDQGTGTVHAHTHVLFPAGSRLRHGETATAEITVYGGPSGRTPVILPVLADAAADGDGTVVLSARQTALTAFAPVRLSFVLRGPGEVALLRPAEGTPDVRATNGSAEEPPEVCSLVERLPRRIVRPPALDVFFTVEMSGAEPVETAERLAFVRDVIAALTRRHGSGDGLRVGVVGHYDHVVRETDYSPRSLLLLTVPAGPARDAQASLARWRPARHEQDTVSSLEDALEKVASATARPCGTRTRPVERALLIVGRRPPGTPEQHGVLPACPLGADWRAGLRAIQDRGVRVRTRLERSRPCSGHEADAVQRYTADAWNTLSADGSFRQGVDTAADVAEALAPEWRWDGPPCRLALATPLL
ncbi:hypothetical protein ACFV8T_09685 [Streptomyces sp. NPDC059832]|uniref:hypothetical protein n=1 Tax=Streptomyces sp. NPDC059832 TaxID=3346966 RepID=UPI00364C893C